jgi:hypothetical protein
VNHCFERYGLMISLYYMWKINCERRGYTPPWCPYYGYPGLNKSPAYILFYILVSLLYLANLYFVLFALGLCMYIEIPIYCVTSQCFAGLSLLIFLFPVPFLHFEGYGRRLAGCRGSPVPFYAMRAIPVAPQTERPSTFLSHRQWQP